MVIAVVGSGGKTTLIHRLARMYRSRGKSVFVTTTTHMFIEEDTLLTDDPGVILSRLRECGYAMAGIPEGEKIRALSPQTYRTVCAGADVTLVEADGSRQMPLKYPRPGEPVLPDNAREVILVCGLQGVGKPAREVCHRLELVKACLGICDDTVITDSHVKTLLLEGYIKPLKKAYPDRKLRVVPVAAPGQEALARELERLWEP